MEVPYSPRYKIFLLLRQPPFRVFSSWRSGYNFMNNYKRSPAPHPYYFQILILKKKKFKSCVFYRSSLCSEYQMMDNFKKQCDR
jgi:hypothetical protein